MSTFEVKQNQFMYDSKPFTLLSGAIHYFRVLPEYWKDRLMKLKACGFNTVETYIAWNMHEPKPGEFCFEEICDIVRFVETAAELGLMVIIRPGPYICAEWEFGGLPSWLLANDDIDLRCYNAPFLERVDMFYDALCSRLKPLLCTNGGPIIAMQVENEYGSFGDDKQYLTHIEHALLDRDMDVLLFTSDGPTDIMLQNGTLPHILKTVNFGSRPEEAFDKLKEYQPAKPLMCMEFWNGWFDHWGTEHHTRDPQDVAQVLDKMLEMGASVNFYMFHGGTNFGFYNGANYHDKYQSTVTSYDYDSPLDETGEPTEKFFAVREVLSKYVEVDKDLLPPPAPKRNFGKVEFSHSIELFKSLDDLSEPIKSACPKPMEKLGQDYGFILYRTKLTRPIGQYTLKLRDVHDRALVFYDDKLIGVIERESNVHEMPIHITKPEATLDILVENMGRVNYGPRLRDMKGITESVLIDGNFVFNWDIYSLPLNNLSQLRFNTDMPLNTPCFYKANFNVDSAADTFLLTEGWTKGVVFINGFNLGRYWNRGPQQTLYVPAPLLREGTNEIVIFELHGTEQPVVKFIDKPLL